jgi:hypothetical protein
MRFHYNLSEYIEFEISDDLLYIHDSYKVKTVNEMEYIIETLRIKYPSCKVLNRSNNSLIHEWRAKNWLYSLGLYKQAGAFNTNSWYKDVFYVILASLYCYV